MKRFSRFDLASFGLLAFIAIFSIVRYSHLPQFIDGYYHLSVANGFIQSGGWVGWDWWSFAPLGRPHLYPPLYHLILVFLQKIGLSGLASVRVTEVAITPLFFFVLWFVFRKLISDKFSFINLLVLSSFFSFYSSVSANLPASLSLIFGFLTWYFIKRKKSVSAIICLTLSFYSHSGLPWVFFVSLLLVSAFDKEHRVLALKTIGTSFLFVLPLVLNFLINRDYLSIKILGEIKFIHFSLFILGLGIPSILFNFFKRDLVRLFFIGYFFGSILIFINYPYRFFSAQGIIGLALFSSLFIEKLFSSFKSSGKGLVIGITAVFLLFCHSTLDLDNGKLKLDLFNSTYYNFLSGKFNQLFEFKPIFSQKLYSPIVKAIKENTESKDIIYSNLSIAAQVFSSLTGRPSSDSMLWEVKPKEDFKPYKYAKIIIWMKPLIKEELRSKRDVKWGLIYENEIAYVFLNLKYSKACLKKVKSSIGFRLLSFLFTCAGVFLVLDNISLRYSKKRE